MGILFVTLELCPRHMLFVLRVSAQPAAGVAERRFRGYTERLRHNETLTFEALFDTSESRCGVLLVSQILLDGTLINQ